MESLEPRGPLCGLRVIEFGSIGPVPYCAMLFADMGADVLSIQREGGNGWPNPIVDRGRATKAVDIRTPEGRDWCAAAAAVADVLIEGFRPGVMERLGLGPDRLCAVNPALVYGRMTGWGQEGPLARSAGHDLNYVGLTGALAAMGRPGEPAPVPLNLVGDYGGGSMFLAFGILAALFERERSGKGQVVDAAIIDGVSSMLSPLTGLLPSGLISLARDRNFLSGAAPFYRSYLCRDGSEIVLASLEPHFFAEFLARVGLNSLADIQFDQSRWGEITGQLAALFASEDREHWVAMFDGSDACTSPVLTVEEAVVHPHHVARGTFVERNSLMQVGPVPRLSRTPGFLRDDGDADAMLAHWIDGSDVNSLIAGEAQNGGDEQTIGTAFRTGPGQS